MIAQNRFHSRIEVLEGRIAPAVISAISGGVLEITGSAASDGVTLWLKAGDPAVLVVNDTFTQEEFALADFDGIVFTAGNGDDMLVLDYANGAFLAADLVTFHGEGGDDVFRIVGTGSEAASLSPSTSAAGSGAAILNARPAVYTGVEHLEAAGLATFGYTTPGSADALVLAEAMPGALDLSGTSGPFAVSLRFTGVGAFTLDTGSHDGAGPDDHITVQSLSSAGLKTFIVNTGAGADRLILDVASLLLPVAGGTFGWNAGAGSDRLEMEADASVTLTGSALASSAGGTLALQGVESASLTGGAGDNLLDASAFAGTVTLSGLGGNDTLLGGSGHDCLLGGDGDDSLAGNAGNDTLLGGANDDLLVGGSGNNALDGGAGTDRMKDAFSGAATLSAAALVGSGNNTLAGIEEASLAGGTGDDTFHLGDWAGAATLDGGDGVDSLVASVAVSATLSDPALTIGSTSYVLNSIERVSLAGGNGGVTLDAGGFSGDATLLGGAGHDSIIGGSGDDCLRGGAGDDALEGGAGDDLLVEEADANLTLTGSALMGIGNDTLAGFERVSLAGGASDNVFDVGGFTGSVTVVGGGGADTVKAVRDADFELGPGALSASDGLAVALSAIEAASLQGGASGNRFTLDGWTGTATLRGAGGSDTVETSADKDFVLTSFSLKVGSVTWTLDSIEAAQLAGGASDNTFDLGGFTGDVTLDGGGGENTLVAERDADFTLGADELVILAVGTTTFTGIGKARLTGGAGNNVLDASAFGGRVTLSGEGGNDTLIGTAQDDVLSGGAGNDAIDGGGGNDTLEETGDTFFVLGNGAMQGLGDDTLSGIAAARLTGGSGNGGFDLTGWSGKATLAGAAGMDTLVFAGDMDFTLTDGSLAPGDGRVFMLAGIEEVSLTGGAGDNAFDVGGWSGKGTLDGGAGEDLLRVTANTDIALSDSALTRAGGVEFALAGFENASLGGGAANQRFTVAWDGGATVQGGAGTDTLEVQGDGLISATATSVSGSGFAVTFSAIESLAIQGGAGDDTLDASAFSGPVLLDGGGGDDSLIGTAFNDTLTGGTGDDTLDGRGGTDLVAESGGTHYVLGSGSMSGVGDDVLVGIERASLAGTAGADTFEILPSWNGAVTLNGAGGPDGIAVERDTHFTLSDSQLSLGSGAVFALQSIELATLAGGASANTFNLSGWTGSGQVDGKGGDDLFTWSLDASATLTGASFIASNGSAIFLTSVEKASLTGGASDNQLDALAFAGSATLIGGAGNDTLIGGSSDDLLDGGEGSDSLVGGGGTDTVRAGADANFALTDTSLAGQGSDTLDGIEAASLSGGAGGNRFTLTGWTGTATVNGASGTDTVALQADTDLVLAPGSLEAAGVTTVTLQNIESADLAGGPGDNRFDLTAWTGTGTVTGGGGDDTLVAGGVGNFRLSDTEFQREASTPVVLDGIANAELTGNVGANRFDVGLFIGRVTLAGGGGSDTVAATGDTDFTLADALLARGNGGDVALSGIGNASLAGGAGANLLDASAFTGNTTLTGGGGDDTFAGGAAFDLVVEEADADFVLAAAALTGNGADVHSGIDAFRLIGGAGANAFAVTDFQGAATLVGGAGDDTFAIARDTDFAVAGAGITVGGGLSVLLDGVETAFLTGGAGDNLFSVNTPSVGLSLDGGTGTDTLDFAADRNQTLSDAQLVAGTGTIPISSLERVILAGGAGDNVLDATAWTGAGVTLLGLGGNDTLRGSGAGDLLDGGDGNDRLEGLGENDTLTGGAGSDTIDGGDGDDLLKETAEGALTLTDALFTGKGNDAISSIERASLVGGIGNNRFDASAFSGPVTLRGGAGDDTLIGGRSDDVLVGGPGNDRMEGGSGDDTYLLGSDTGYDRILDSKGRNTLDYSGSPSEVKVKLTDGKQAVAPGATIHIRGNIQDIIGSDFADTLVGNGKANRVFGGGGDDLIKGKGGNDTLFGGAGDDTLNGGRGKNVLDPEGSLPFPPLLPSALATMRMAAHADAAERLARIIGAARAIEY